MSKAGARRADRWNAAEPRASPAPRRIGRGRGRRVGGGLARDRLGRQVYALGSSSEAARLRGIEVVPVQRGRQHEPLLEPGLGAANREVGVGDEAEPAAVAGDVQKDASPGIDLPRVAAAPPGSGRAQRPAPSRRAAPRACQPACLFSKTACEKYASGESDVPDDAAPLLRPGQQDERAGAAQGILNRGLAAGVWGALAGRGGRRGSRRRRTRVRGRRALAGTYPRRPSRSQAPTIRRPASSR